MSKTYAIATAVDAKVLIDAGLVSQKSEPDCRPINLNGHPHLVVKWPGDSISEARKRSRLCPDIVILTHAEMLQALKAQD